VSAILLLDGVTIIISYRSSTIAISKHLVTIRNASVDLLHPQESGIISYRSPVIANLPSQFSNVVTMATGVGLRQIALTQLNSPTPKTPCLVQELGTYLPYKLVIANFLLKFSNFRYRGNRGWSEINFTYTVKFADPENPLIGAIIGGVSSIQAEL